MKMKKIMSLLLAGTLCFGAAACSSKPTGAPAGDTPANTQTDSSGSKGGTKTIGIAMPTKSS